MLNAFIVPNAGILRGIYAGAGKRAEYAQIEYEYKLDMAAVESAPTITLSKRFTKLVMPCCITIGISSLTTLW